MLVSFVSMVVLQSWFDLPPPTFAPVCGAVFSKAAASRTGVCLQHAGRHARVRVGRWERRTVGGRGAAEAAAEARGEGADAAQADREADVGDRPVRGAEQCRRALE